jgi:hypothetical protein
MRRRFAQTHDEEVRVPAGATRTVRLRVDPGADGDVRGTVRPVRVVRR